MQCVEVPLYVPVDVRLGTRARPEQAEPDIARNQLEVARALSPPPPTSAAALAAAATIVAAAAAAALAFVLGEGLGRNLSGIERPPLFVVTLLSRPTPRPLLPALAASAPDAVGVAVA